MSFVPLCCLFLIKICPITLINFFHAESLYIDNIFERDIKTLSTADIRANRNDLSPLEKALVVCLQSNSFHDAIENAAQLDNDPIRAALIASTAGSLYGMEHSNTLYDELRAYTDKKRKKEEQQRDDEEIEVETRKLCDFLLSELHTK